MYNLNYNESNLETMSRLQDNSVDLIFTSPPYAERRKQTYGGVNENKYVEWFIPIAKEMKRVIKPTGSIFINIKPHTTNGERSLYVFELILALKRECGLMFIEEYCWTKNGFPGMLKGRFKNAFEPVYHFTKCGPAGITFNPIACGTPIKEESIARTYRKQCGPPKNGSGMTGMNTTNIRNLEFARPSNVVNVNNVSNQFSDKKLHSATFPIGLVDFFVKSFSNENDLVYDPFMGSGTTALSAIKNGRNWIGSEILSENCQIIEQRVKNAELLFF